MTTIAPTKKDIASIIEAASDQFSRALGSMIPASYFCRVAVTAVRKSPLLQQCTPQSVLGCLMDMAQLRLTPGVLGEAYMVPFFNGKSNCYEAVLMVGYKGFVKLLRRNAKIKNMRAEVVYEKDEFVIQHGSQRHLIHVPHWRDSNRGEPLGAYAYMEDENGEDFRFVPMDYILRVKQSSKGAEKPDSPWNTWPESMWCKTAIKQLLKTADLSPEVAEAMAKDMESAIDVESTVVGSTATAIASSNLATQRQAPVSALPERAQSAAPLVMPPPQQQQPEMVTPGRPRRARTVTAPAPQAMPAPATPAPQPAAPPAPQQQDSEPPADDGPAESEDTGRPAVLETNPQPATNDDLFG